MGRFRLFIQQLHEVITAQIGRHQDHGVTKINFAPFAVAHKAPVKYLIEQVNNIGVRFLNFIKQHHAVRAFAHRFSQNAALTVTDIARRRTFQLRNGVRLLIFGHVDGDQRFLATEQRIGQRQRGLGFTHPTRPDQQEYAQRTIFGGQPGFGSAQALCHINQRRILTHYAGAEMVFQLQQIRLFVFQQTAQRDAGPVSDNRGDGADINIQRQQRRTALNLIEFCLQLRQMCHVGDILTRFNNQCGETFLCFILLFQLLLPNGQLCAAFINLR
ncbi:Protein of uncharacterised function (DUF3170) [Yersinia similis]|uniref:Protein of uncharacterized function (DUF3170) n=1 Tax=Yersinia similis TaxID=367190 RepID=A0A0T9RPP2_9GAMM|nr:Protein of uncharacterised function (DUF3170) [Yersinia similis]